MKDNNIRILGKQEINTEGKSSLAGTCAVRLYHDGNITFSHQASELLNFSENKYFQLCENDKDEILLMPNNTEGYKPNKRKDKYCYLYNSKPIIRYLAKRFKKEISKGKPLEFLIKKTEIKIEDNNCFKLQIL